MTEQYHPVTKEEPDLMCQRRGIQYLSYNGRLRDELVKEILSRPDPLALLEAYAMWAKDRTQKEDEENMYYTRCEAWDGFERLLKQLRTNPEAVREQGIKEGWWHDD